MAHTGLYIQRSAQVGCSRHTYSLSFSVSALHGMQ